MKYYFLIPLNKFNQNISITFHASENRIVNSEPNLHFSHLESDWLKPFLLQYELHDPKHPQDFFSGKLNIVREDILYKVNGHLKFAPMLECVRCLDKFRKQVYLQPSGLFLKE
ncbi:MAG: hypothetical protein K2X39_02620, partial [Silvanigrellaceae bacterium]|nr:hypothetical protein [Silvanigrellaceae bacterium]